MSNICEMATQKYTEPLIVCSNKINDIRCVEFDCYQQMQQATVMPITKLTAAIQEILSLVFFSQLCFLYSWQVEIL